MSNQESKEEIEKQQDLENYYVVVTKGFEKQGGNFLYAGSLRELDQTINQLNENQTIVPVKEALEKNYPIQALNTYEWLYDIADNYVLSYEMNQRISDSLGVFQYQDEDVLLVGHVENDRLFFSFTDYYGYEVSSVSEEEPIDSNQVAIIKGKNLEEHLLIDQGYIHPESVHEYKNRYGEEIKVFNLTDKGARVKQEVHIGSKNTMNKVEKGHRNQQRDMEI